MGVLEMAISHRAAVVREPSGWTVFAQNGAHDGETRFSGEVNVIIVAALGIVAPSSIIVTSPVKRAVPWTDEDRLTAVEVIDNRELHEQRS